MASAPPPARRQESKEDDMPLGPMLKYLEPQNLTTSLVVAWALLCAGAADVGVAHCGDG